MPSISNKDYYAILGVQNNANADDIRKAYRKLMRENHPDKAPGNPDATVKTQEIVEAYEVLYDPVKRCEYDLNFFKAPLDSIYDIRKLSLGLEEDAKQYPANRGFNDGYGYRVTSKWRREPEFSKDLIYLSKLRADNLAENCKILGSFVRMSFEKGFNGKIKFRISLGGPHDKASNILMLLKLGMIPEANESYLNFFAFCVDEIINALTALSACKKPDELSDVHWLTLAQMIAWGRKSKALSEKSISENIIEEVITKGVLFRHKDILVTLQDKKVVPHGVIPNILKAVAEFGDSDSVRLPELVDVTLVMSESGIKRWKTAILQNKDFQPFALEHLELSEEQVEELTTVYPKYRSLRQETLTRTINNFFNTTRVSSTNLSIEDVIVGYAM